jgi:acyl-CoA synthetase (NDP forming)
MTPAAAPLAADKAGLDALLDPGSVAVIGASDSPQRIGGRVVAHLKRSFDGAVVPVNPARREVQGLPTFPSVNVVPALVDLAIAVVPADEVPQAARSCAAAGVRALVVSSGFAEAGGHGTAL